MSTAGSARQSIGFSLVGSLGSTAAHFSVSSPYDSPSNSVTGTTLPSGRQNFPYRLPGGTVWVRGHNPGSLPELPCHMSGGTVSVRGDTARVSRQNSLYRLSGGTVLVNVRTTRLAATLNYNVSVGHIRVNNDTALLLDGISLFIGGMGRPFAA